MRRDRLLWGIVLTALGVVLLLRQLGVLPAALGLNVIWPVLVILVGIWVLLAATSRRELETERLTLPLEGVERARVRMKHGAGKLHVGPAVGPGELLSGTFVGGVEHHLTREGDGVDVELRLGRGTAPWTVFPMFGPQGGLAWDVGLNPDVTLDLEVETGASETTLDLTEMNVTDLRVRTGASATRISLPAHAGRVRARVDSGVAETIIRVPDGVAARIRVENGLGDVSVNPVRFPRVGGGYASPDYDAAIDAVDLDVRNGVGAIRIE